MNDAFQHMREAKQRADISILQSIGLGSALAAAGAQNAAAGFGGYPQTYAQISLPLQPTAPAEPSRESLLLLIP